MFSTVILLVILLLLWLYIGSRKPKGYPPGPKWWPILGSTMEMKRLRRETGYVFKACSALCKKYGPVIGLKIGRTRVVVLNDYKSIKAMLHDDNCEGRPTGCIYDVRTFGTKRGLIFVDENLWIEQRRFVLKHLRDFGFGRNSMAVIIEEESQSLVEYYKRLIINEYNGRMTESVMYCNNNEYTDGQMYKLTEKGNIDIVTNKCKERETVANMHVNANEYIEVGKMAPSTPGIVILMDEVFPVTVLNTLWRMMASKRFNINDEEINYLQRILTNALKEIDMVGAPFSHFPILRFIAPEMSGYNSFMSVHQPLWKFLRDELNNHKSTLDPASPRDLIDAYLTMLKSKDCSNTFSELQLLSICLDLFIAGSETTSKTLGYCFLNLILSQDVQKKAHDEIDRVIGRNRPPTLGDRAKMTYMNAIVLESLRMFMGTTLNVPHRALKDTYILDHKIPKDTMILANFPAILMDESWGDPENFRPERFIDESGNIVTPHMYFPFSIGRHRCMGENLAKSNIFLITTTLLQAFTFTPVPGEKKPSKDDYVEGVTTGPKPFRALVSLRT